MKRRRFLVTGLAAGAGIGSLSTPHIRVARAAMNIDPKQMTKTLRFSSYGGAWQATLTKAAIEPFEKKYDVKVLQETHGNEEQLIAKMKAAGPGSYDVVTVNESGIYIGVKQGTFEALRLENIPNYSNLIVKLQKPSYDPGPGIHSVPDVYGSNAIVYNTKHVEKPKGWDVLWDPRYKGRIVVRDSAIYREFTSALYLGQDPNKLTDVEKIYDSWRKQLPLTLKLYGGTSEMQTLITNQEAWVGEFVGGRTAVLKEQGVPVDYFIPSSGVRGFIDCVGICKGSPNRYTAEVFLNYLLEPEVAEQIGELTKYPHCLDPKKAPKNDKIASLPDYDDTGTLSRFIFVDYGYMEANRATWEAAWTKIKLGG